ncbi:MAG: hypothetical protein WCS42_22115 [Verrucomicrobiota bacterium]
MAFDPNFPPDHQDLNAAPFRNQFNSLKALSDSLQTQINNFQAQLDAMPENDGMIDSITDRSARNVDGFQTLTLTISNPPTQAEVQAFVTKFNDLVGGLHH